MCDVANHGGGVGPGEEHRGARGQARRLHICPSETRKCVDDGFTPSRPLRSLGHHATHRAVKFAPLGLVPIRLFGTLAVNTAQIVHVMV
jgi:hypothetical protein